MASVHKRETSRGVRYDVRYRGTDGGGYSRTFRTRHDADRFAASVETDKTRGGWVDPKGGRVTLAEYATDWLQTRAGLRPRTRETYEGQLRLHVLRVSASSSSARSLPSPSGTGTTTSSRRED